MAMVTNPKGTSFFCEHTAEYIIVSRMRALLETRYANVVPVYFWRSREGNLFSNQIHENLYIRIFAVYPRRPKLKSPESETIIVKINEELYEYSQAAKLAGIPTIVGIPLVNSISKLLNRCTIMWLSLSDEILEDVHFEVKSNSGKIISVLPMQQKFETIEEENLPDIVKKHAKRMVWKDAIDMIRSVGYQQDNNKYFRRPFYFGGYKPVYFLIFDQ